MKHRLVIIALFLSICGMAQTVPQKISYQAVARNSAGAILANQAIAVKADILDTDLTTVLYAETHAATTNQFGLFTLQVGGGTAISGTFASINWGSGNKHIRTSVDLTGGSNYQVMGTSQLLSVPYALYAGSAANNGGKTILVLSDTISNAGAQAKIATEFGPNTQQIRIGGCSNLTTVDLSMVTKIVDINISDNPVLQSINLSKLVVCEGDFAITNCAALNTLTVTSLERLCTGYGQNGFLIYLNAALVNLSFPALKVVNASLYFQNNNSLTTISCPLLSTAASLNYYGNNSIISLSFPSLTSLSGSINSNISSTNLTSITFSNLSSFKNLGFVVSGCKLPSSQINYLLNKFVSITPNLTGKIFDFSGQTPTAAPTGQGITDKATLIARGNTVNTN